MAKGDKRTQKDEDDYNIHLRREDPIKTEIICQLRDENQVLWESQAWILRALNEATRALLIYRENQINAVEHRLKQSFHDALLVKGYRWDNVDGWHRTDEESGK